MMSFAKVRVMDIWSSPPGDIYEPVAVYVPSVYTDAVCLGTMAGVETGIILTGLVVGLGGVIAVIVLVFSEFSSSLTLSSSERVDKEGTFAGFCALLLEVVDEVVVSIVVATISALLSLKKVMD